jgi:hypothetical protein
VVYHTIFEKTIIVEHDVFQIYCCDQIAFNLIKHIFVLLPSQCTIYFALGFSMLEISNGNDVTHIVIPFQVQHKLYYFHFC